MKKALFTALMLLALPAVVAAQNLRMYDTPYPFSEMGLKCAVEYWSGGDGDGEVKYIGFAAPGSYITETRWQIAYFEYSTTGMTTRTFADGTNSYTKAWADRATYDYHK